MLLKRFFRRSAPPQVDRKQVLRLYPLRNAAVQSEQNEDGVYILIVPLKPRGLFGWFSRIFKLPREHRIELDEIGSLVWSLCDGRHQVETIVQRLVQQFKLERREAEYSLFAFLNTLPRRGFIAYTKKRL
ncbi:MAG: PqqD family protein [Fimbriimonadales bacterium]|nr:PqqD family protein [Fimbriimonadales bacterium]